MKQNYMPLFRKYRPQSFDDVVGQKSLVKALSNAIELNRIANAYLFCGPRGTGKTSTARIFAKSLNCVEGPTLKPCQKCASCIDITNASGLDVIEIDAASNRGIQDAKDLISRVQYAPINGKYKIFIIDEVHMLSNDAFNALLKTFEEPPENVIFILATTEPHKVLETIVSRCQRFDLKRITTDDIVKRLREISDIENIKITDEALFTIANNVSGGLRDSLALLDQVSILGVKDEISKDLIEELLGKINFDTLLNLLKDIYSESFESALITINEIYSKGSEPRNLAENFIEFLRNIVLILNSKQKESIKKISSLTDDNIKKACDLNFDKDKIIKILDTIIEYYKEIKISTNPYLWMELAAIAACKTDLIYSQKNQTKANTKIQAIKPSETIDIKTDNPSEKIEIPKTDTKEKPILKETIPDSLSGNIQNNKTIQKEDTKDNEEINEAKLWTKIVSSIPSLPAKAFYSGVAKLVEIKNKTIVLGFLHENTLLQAKTPSKMSQLQSAVDITCKDYGLEFRKIEADSKVVEVKPKITSNTIKKPNPSIDNIQNTPIVFDDISENSAESSEEKEEIEKEKKYYSPKVRDMIEQFSGRIIE